MKIKTKAISAAISGLLALGLLAGTANAADSKDGEEDAMEKCYGVAKAGKNDCAANGHACAGQSKTSGDPGEWITVPAGTCERLIDGSTEPKK